MTANLFTKNEDCNPAKSVPSILNRHLGYVSPRIPNFFEGEFVVIFVYIFEIHFRNRLGHFVELIMY